jgi:hypothetical protein
VSLAFDPVAYVQNLATTSPEVIIIGLALSGWYLFSKACRASLKDLADLHINFIDHLTRSQQHWAKYDEARRVRLAKQSESPHTPPPSSGLGPGPRSIEGDRDHRQQSGKTALQLEGIDERLHRCVRIAGIHQQDAICAKP